MSVVSTEKLSRKDLRYLLLDSLRIYSDDVAFLDGNNPYRFAINKKTFYVLIKNSHESGDGRSNQDECRIQVSKSKNFNQALSSKEHVIVLGYLADHNVFTAWNPFLMRSRFNQKDTISLYSRFSIQRKAQKENIALYTDNNGQNIISFKPEYLGLYLDNLDKVHQLSNNDLISLVNTSDTEIDSQHSISVESSEGDLKINHSRRKRDPVFRKVVNDAYENRCAMCGIQLGLIEAAHIVPHANDEGTDDVGNGVSLCVLHHKAYDNGLIYFDQNLKIKYNNDKLNYLTKYRLDAGLGKFQNLTFDELQQPRNPAFRIIRENIILANKIRGID